MAADSDGCSVRTVVTCEGDLGDPRFPGQLGRVLSELQAVLGVRPKVHKLEPWNSVRVTLSIPREAALRLRQLANNGSHLLRSLGILSVQVEGDQVISLRLATANSQEPQEIILRAVQDGSASSGDNNSLSQILAGAVEATQAAATSNAAVAATAAACAQSVPTIDKVQFRSPNVVCPADSIVPKVPNNNTSSSIGVNGGLSLPASNAAAAAAAAATAAASIAPVGPSSGPFPFTSMNQAIHTHRNLNNNPALHPIPLPIVTNISAVGAVITNSISSNSVPLNVTSTTHVLPPTLPPPPYPGVHPPVTLSSPLLVNLLQNEGGSSSINGKAHFTVDEYKQQQQQQNLVSMPVVGARNNHAIVLVSDTKSVIANNNVLHHHRQVQQQPINNMAKVATSSAFNSASVKVHTTTTNCVMINSSSVTSPSLSVSANFTNVHHSGGSVSIDAIQANAASISNRSPVPYRPYPTPAPPPPPPPPAYPTTTTMQRSSSLWDQQQQQQQSVEQQLQDLTPSLTDLKEVDLVHLLPTLESDLAGSPLLDLPDDLICSSEIRPSHNNYLINPLTGELEPHQASEADEEEVLQDVFTGLSSPAALLSDEDTNSTIRPDTTDQSDSESRSGHHSSDSSKPQRIKRSKDKGHRSDSPSVSKQSASKTELKLRFKLEKSEPVAAAYKVDYINPNQLKKSTVSIPAVSSTDEPRVPPLHISLRGRNHVVISNKKKVKLNSDGTPMKVKQRTKLLLDQQKLKKIIDEGKGIDESNLIDLNLEIGKKSKRPKLIHDVDVSGATTLQDPAAISMTDKVTAVYNIHYKEKLKERRGSDSELVKINSGSASTGNNGMLNIHKKRRLSQSSELEESLHPSDSIMPVLGSTNTGTVSSISNHKQRKFKLKDTSIRMRDVNRFKNYNPKTVDKTKQTVVLPTGEIDMEAKFKQRLLEEQTDRRGTTTMSTAYRATSTSTTTVVTSSVSTTPTSNTLSSSILHNDSSATSTLISAKRAVVIVEEQKRLVVDDLLQTLEQNTTSPPPLKDKPPPEPDKCNTPDQQAKVKQSIPPSTDVATVHAGARNVAVVPGSAGSNTTANANNNVVSRSPNGGAQGEDSGIESMDALSEKSPNQASQSPHGELPETSTTMPSNSNNSANSVGAVAAAGGAMQCVRSGSSLISTPTTMPNSAKAQTAVPSVASVNKMIAGGCSNSGSMSVKSQVPVMLDIEAQLAKMEGLNGADEDADDDDDLDEEEEDEEDEGDDEEEDDDDLQHLVDGDMADDPNENNALVKVDQLSDKQMCCLPSTMVTATTTTSTTGAILDNRKHVAIMQTTTNIDETQAKIKLVGTEGVRITPPPRYTYAAASEKHRHSSSSPPPLHLTSNNNNSSGSASSNASGSGASSHPSYKGSLLKQLLIDIPDSNHHHHSTRSSSPSTTITTASTSGTTISTPSVRTRAASKLNSPELNSPVGGTRQRVPVSNVGPAPVIHTVPSVTTAVIAKRKRYESDGSASNHSASADDATTNRLKKVRKHSENTAEFIKSCIGTDSKRKKVPEESSDDEQPLIEMAKSKKGPPTPTLSSLAHVTGTGGGLASIGGGSVVGMTPRVKLKATAGTAVPGGAATTATAAVLVNSTLLASKIGPINTRRSIRAIPALNTRSKGDKTNPESDILRRKTRSAVSEGEGKRRKDIK